MNKTDFAIKLLSPKDIRKLLPDSHCKNLSAHIETKWLESWPAKPHKRNKMRYILLQNKPHSSLLHDSFLCVQTQKLLVHDKSDLSRDTVSGQRTRQYLNNSPGIVVPRDTHQRCVITVPANNAETSGPTWIAGSL